MLESESRTEAHVLASEQRIEKSLRSLTDAIHRLDVKVSNVKEDIVTANRATEDRLLEKLPKLIQANNADMMWIVGLGGLSVYIYWNYFRSDAK